EARGQRLVNPSPDEELWAGDDVFLLGEAFQRKSARELLAPGTPRSIQIDSPARGLRPFRKQALAPPIHLSIEGRISGGMTGGPCQRGPWRDPSDDHSIGTRNCSRVGSAPIRLRVHLEGPEN